MPSSLNSTKNQREIAEQSTVLFELQGDALEMQIQESIELVD